MSRPHYAPTIRAPWDQSFGALLDHYIKRSGLSQNRLAPIAGVEVSYINRLCRGDREGPSRPIVLALARTLELRIDETDALLFAADLVPQTWQKLGPSDSTVAAVTELLTNDRISPESRADFRAVVEIIAGRWGHP